MRRLYGIVVVLLFLLVATSLYWWLHHPSTIRNQPVSGQQVRIVRIDQAGTFPDRWLSEKYLQPVWFAPPRERISREVNHLKAHLQNNPKDVVALADLVILLEQNHQWEEALSYSQKWTQLEPDSIDAWLSNVYCLVNLGRLEEAVRVLDGAIKRNKDSVAKAYFLSVQGEVYIMLESFVEEPEKKQKYLDSAGFAFASALDLLPNFGRANIGLVRWHLDRERKNINPSAELSKAQHVIDKLYKNGVNSEREQVLTAYYQGVVYERKGNLGLAKQYYRAAIKGDPQSFVFIDPPE